MSTPDEQWAAIELLAEPTRRRVYDAVCAAGSPVTRESAAQLVGISQRLAAFHLDRLADGGLLSIDYARPAGRMGPGAGRPAKRYARAAVDVAVSLPTRRYDVVARILTAAVATDPTAADSTALRIARQEGQQAGERLRASQPRRRPTGLPAAETALHALGYEPVREDGNSLRLRNCPFHDVVDIAPRLVCGLNEQVIAGLLDGLGAAGSCQASLEPLPPNCCVRVTRRSRRKSGQSTP